MKKVFIARRDDGVCYIYENRPKRIPGGYTCSSGQVKAFDLTIAYLMGIPYPKPGEMIEWPPPDQTAAPEPKPLSKKLVPITDLAQLNVGDMVRNDKLERKVLAVGDMIVALSDPYDHEKLVIRYSLYSLIYWGYQQVASEQRTLSRDEARKAIIAGKKVRVVGGDIWYVLSDAKEYIISGIAESRRWWANINVFDIPEVRYEIVS